MWGNVIVSIEKRARGPGKACKQSECLKSKERVEISKNFESVNGAMRKRKRKNR